MHLSLIAAMCAAFLVYLIFLGVVALTSYEALFVISVDDCMG